MLGDRPALFSRARHEGLDEFSRGVNLNAGLLRCFRVGVFRALHHGRMMKRTLRPCQDHCIK